MLKRTRTIPAIVREGYPEDLFQKVFSYLNAHNTKTKWSMELLEEMQRIEAKPQPAGSYGLPSGNRQAALNRRLANESFSPFLVFLGERVGWVVRWFKTIDRRVHGVRDSDAVNFIFAMAEAGDLNRVRRCGHCQKWFYAGKRHQRFCSHKCQQSEYTKSPEWKERRRKYMRDYYRVKRVLGR